MPTLRTMTAHNNLHAMLYQVSAEYVALCTQVYQLARHALVERQSQKVWRNEAVVMDLDETVLDNSAYQAWQIRAGTNFDEATSWTAWCNEGAAGAVPGAVEFLRFAASKGVTPIFITSRPNTTRVGTARNLHRLGLIDDAELAVEERVGGQSPASHAAGTRLFMKKMPPYEQAQPGGARTYPLENKFQQRVFCERVRGLEVILSVGDSLGDYAEYYGRLIDKSGAYTGGHPEPKSRMDSVLQDQRLFGRDFILIPNSMYGGWLRAYEANGRGASDELAPTGTPVRETLNEPQEPFKYDETKPPVAPVGPKFLRQSFPIWEGPRAEGAGR